MEGWAGVMVGDMRVMRWIWSLVGMGCLAPLALAQVDYSKLLLDGVRNGVLGLKPVPEREKQAVSQFVAEALMKRVTFRRDGVATSVHELHGARTYIEWKGFKVSQITEEAVTEADKANGVTRRYRVGFSCDASRSWDPKGNRWKEWTSTGYLLFPSGCTVEEKGGSWMVLLYEQGRFLPGPVNAVASGAAHQPVEKGEVVLPPGMRRSGE